MVDEGERDKILQPPASNTNAENAPNSAPAPQPKVPDVALEPALEPEPQNSVPFPSEQEPAKELLPEPLQEEDPQPDAAFAVSTLSQFIQNPRTAHWEVLKCMIIFLRSMKDLWLTFGG